ncbi:ATP-binding protein [Anaerolineales bacterium HSG25]|nr:ATP-binding protein [Anaerolineales bacterium HSG25]
MNNHSLFPNTDLTVHYLDLIESTRPPVRAQQNPPFLFSVADGLLAENTRLHRALKVERIKNFQLETQQRKILAGELHDGPAQLISAGIMYLDMIKEETLDQTNHEALQEIKTTQALLRRVDYQLRTLCFEFRPIALQTQGLPAALQGLIDRSKKDMYASAEITLELYPINPINEISRFKEQIEQLFFRLAIEALHNALKHACANLITVRLEETTTHLQLTVADDGVGFDVAEILENYEGRGSYGLYNLQTLANLVDIQITISSIPDEGTMLTFLLQKSTTSA